MSGRSPDRPSGSVVGAIRSAFVTGVAVVVPLLLSLIVLAVAGRYVYQYLDLFSTLVLDLSSDTRYVVSVSGVRLSLTKESLIELLTPVVLAAIVLTVGVSINATRFGAVAVDYLDAAIGHVPGIGAVYESFREMSDVMINEDTQNFRDVKLVEFPHEGAYTLGFLTTETPDALREPAGHDRMLTLFLPLAPNPVMGGHLVHMPADRVMDVDMTVEEGLRAVVTSGVAVPGGSVGGDDGISAKELRTLSRVEHADQRLSPEMGASSVRRPEPKATDRTDEWDRQVAPERSETPSDVARRTRERREASEEDAGQETDDSQPYSLYGGSEAASTPAREAGRYEEESDAGGGVPEREADRPASDRDRTGTPPAKEPQRGSVPEAPAEPDPPDGRVRNNGDGGTDEADERDGSNE